MTIVTDTYIVFDLEATCWNYDQDSKPGLPVSKYVPIREELNALNAMEVIEIGAVALDATKRLAFGEPLEVVGEFDPFVRPTIHPVLSEFCTALTTITQADVDNADTIETVLPEFIEWARSFTGDAKFISWGLFDKAIFERMKNKQGKDLDIKYLVRNHISVKHRARKVGLPGKGLGKVVNKLGLTFDGTPHRGIDDARMIAQVFNIYFDKTILEYKRGDDE